MLKTEKPLIEVFGRRPGRSQLALKGAELAGVGSQSRILEVGCAFGDTARLLAETYGCAVTGIDVVREYIERAVERSRLANGQVEFVVADAAKLPFPSQSFSHVICEAVFSLLSDKEAVVAEFHRVLHEHGRVIINDFILKHRIAENIQKKMEFVPCFYGVKTAWEYTRLFSQNGFRQLSFSDHSTELARTAMWLSKAYGISIKELDRLFVSLLSQGNCQCENLHHSRRFFQEARLGYGQFIFEKI